jgi:hypothetical protein
MNKLSRTATALAVGMLFASAAMAQTTGSTVQRDVNQQERIEQGLQSGELTTHEAGQLERQESTVEKMQSNALRDGSLNNAERARLRRTQDRVSSDIYRDKHNTALGDPNSASSARMQADVQRNVNQQARIEQGVRSGELTNRETASLERGQSHVNRTEARAGANGHVGPIEQGNVQVRENRQSKRVFAKKHNDREKS